MCVFSEPVLLKLNSLVNFYKCFSKKTFFFLNAFVSETSFDIGYIKEFGFYFRCHVTEKFEVMFICFNQYVCVKERERENWFCGFKRLFWLHCTEWIRECWRGCGQTT